MMLVLQFYYQDTRVLISLNIEPLAPYPKGFALEEGDWSLLDSVKNDWYLKAPSK